MPGRRPRDPPGSGRRCGRDQGRRKSPPARSHKTIAPLRSVPIKVVPFVMAPMASVRLVALLFLDTGSITGVIRRGQRQALLPGADVHCRRPGDDAAAPGTAFDPAGLANPSKLFATPAGAPNRRSTRRCCWGGEGGGVLKHRAANRALARILRRRGGCAGAAGDSCRRQQRRRRGGEGRERG